MVQIEGPNEHLRAFFVNVSQCDEVGGDGTLAERYAEVGGDVAAAEYPFTGPDIAQQALYFLQPEKAGRSR